MSRVVSFGEIMMRLNTPGYSRFSQAMPGSMNITFAGAEANISASLAFWELKPPWSQHYQTTRLQMLA